MSPDRPDYQVAANWTLNQRFVKTLAFLKATLPPPARLLDLGPPNQFSDILRSEGYEVINTEGDLDEHPEVVAGIEADAVTGFEILEHLVAPLALLRQLEPQRGFFTVPMRLWFAPAYRHPTNPWDRHYHEFEDWQFDWLMEKGGWDIVRAEKWKSPIKRLGVRPLLRRITPRYYAVEVRRSSKDEA